MSYLVKVATERGLINASVEFEGGRIASITPVKEEAELLMLPGFIDVHTHGACMIDVNHIRGREDMEKLSTFFASRGVTSLLLSLMTDTEEAMKRQAGIIAEALEEPLPGARIEGIHLEGPFLSSQYKGAMPEELLKEADWTFLTELIKASKNKVKYITLAPEKPGMIDLISRIRKETDIVISMGHSAAEYECAVAAVERGVTSATHLFNAMKLFHMHYPAISGAALERDEVYCETICDGFHLHSATVRLILKTKGEDKVVCISDSIMATGMEKGTYKLGVNDVIVTEDGDAKLVDGVRAGSTLTLDKAYRNLVKFIGRDDPALFSKLLSTNAARMMGWTDRGEIRECLLADCTIMNAEREVVETIVGGRTVYRKEGK